MQRNTGRDFESLVNRSGGPDACHPWTEHVNKNGYGRYRLGRAHEYAHREAYRRSIGEPPEAGSGWVIDHRCHDPKTCAGGSDCMHRRCCNPLHLKVVRHEENVSWDRLSRDPVQVRGGGVCTVCGYPAHHSGLCAAHYSRWHRTGDVRADVPVRGRK